MQIYKQYITQYLFIQERSREKREFVVGGQACLMTTAVE